MKMPTEDDIRRAINAALHAGARTPDEVKAFVLERLRPIVHVETHHSEADVAERRLNVSIAIAYPSGSEH